MTKMVKIIKENPIKKIVSIIEQYSPVRYSLILALPVFTLIIGFIIWNIYLYTFGFVEDEILKAKFILSGILFFIFTIILWLFIELIFKIFDYFFKWLQSVLNRIEKVSRILVYISRFNRLVKSLSYVIIIPLLSFWLILYTIYIFPILPSVIGGGQPRSLSLIADSDNMQILNSLNIIKPENAPHQTENICIVHENSQAVYVLRKDRVLSLDKLLFQGFGSLPGTKVIMEQKCIQYAQNWSKQGFELSTLLFFASIVNLFSDFLSLPKIYFDI